jgi:O-antigen/teichoic acid export membrane protein
MSGSVAAQAVGVALSPVISRLFTPADFGVFGSFIAVTGVVSAVATFDYSQAIMLPRRRDDAGQVLLVSCLVALVVALASGLVCFLLPRWILGLLNTGDRWLLPLFVLAVLAAGLNASLQAWCVRVKAFEHTSISQVVRGVSSAGCQLGFGVARAGAPGLILSHVMSEFLAGVNLLRVTLGDLRAFVRLARWETLGRLAMEYRDFPMYSASQNLLNALSNGLPVLLLTQSFGISAAGAYAFGMRLINAPMSLVSNALRQVLLQRAGEMQHQERRLLPLFVKSTAGLFGLGLGPTLILAIWAPGLFEWLFGRQWHTAGEFARYLALWLLFAFCNLPAVLMARLIRIQRALFIYNLFLLAARVAALLLGGQYLTVLQCIALFSAVGVVMNAILILIVGRALVLQEGPLELAQL